MYLDHTVDNPLEADSVDKSPEGWKIRLITLLPGTANESLRCHLRSSYFRDCRTSYEALSYVWGDPKLPEAVLINGREFLVTRNLASALRRLRLPDRARELWIDAICINQEDSAEKTVQVRRMGAIFENASRVIVDIGEESDSCSAAIDLLKRIGNLTESNQIHASIDNLLQNTSLFSSWQALELFFQRPWWGRSWIVQEYVLAPKVLFICGTAEIEESSFSYALTNLIDYRFNAHIPKQHESLIRHVASTNIHHLWSTRDRLRKPNSPAEAPVLEVLYKFRRSQCMDSRDKVFSIFSLIKKHKLLVPDYSRSETDIFTSVVQASINTTNDLEVLTHHNNGCASKLKLPSWCPDWTILRGRRIRLWPNDYSASGAFNKAIVNFTDDKMVLRGVYLAQIQNIEPFESRDFHSNSRMLRKLKAFEAVALNSSPTDCPLDHRYGSIRASLVAGRVRPGGPQQGAAIVDYTRARTLWNAWFDYFHAEEKVEENKQDAKLYNDALYSALCGRSAFVSSAGHIGVVDNGAAPGDEIFVLCGGRVLFAIRPVDGSAGDGSVNYRLVGEW